MEDVAVDSRTHVLAGAAVGAGSYVASRMLLEEKLKWSKLLICALAGAVELNVKVTAKVHRHLAVDGILVDVAQSD